MAGCDPAQWRQQWCLPIIVTFNPQGGKSTYQQGGDCRFNLWRATCTNQTWFYLLRLVYWKGRQYRSDQLNNSNQNQSHTLYAHWSGPITTKTVTVTFDPQGGTVSPASKEVTVGSAHGTLPTPNFPSIIKKLMPQTKNLRMVHWKVGGNKVTEDTIVTIDQDHTLYAQWDPIYRKSHRTFDTNGGTPIPSP